MPNPYIKHIDPKYASEIKALVEVMKLYKTEQETASASRKERIQSLYETAHKRLLEIGA